jgi:hypothetical protein
MTAERNEYRFEAQRARIDERKRIGEELGKHAASIGNLAMREAANRIEAGTL